MFERLRNAGILVNLHYFPVYRHPYYEKMGYKPSDFPEAEAYYEEAISLPMFPTLTIEQQETVVDCVNQGYPEVQIDEKPKGYQNIF